MEWTYSAQRRRISERWLVGIRVLIELGAVAIAGDDKDAMNVRHCKIVNVVV
jgi:hypothetical protein